MVVVWVVVVVVAVPVLTPAVVLDAATVELVLVFVATTTTVGALVEIVAGAFVEVEEAVGIEFVAGGVETTSPPSLWTTIEPSPAVGVEVEPELEAVA